MLKSLKTDGLEDQVVEVMLQVAPAKDEGKNNKKKSKNSRLKDNDENDDDNVVQGDGDDDVTKKLNLMKNGNYARFTPSGFELLGDDGESSGVQDQDGDGASSETDGNAALASRFNDDSSSLDGDASTVIFSGKKKSSKKKSNTGFTQLEAEGSDKVVGEQEKPGTGVSGRGVDNNQSKETSDGVVVTSVKKKNKKKSKRTAQEEEDLDKILAELGVGPPPVKTDTAPQQEEKVPTQTEPEVAADTAVDKKDEEGVLLLSAAAKKKKKKKEKEKEKKAAAAAAVAPSVEEKREGINRVADKKKVPRHVKEMQERIAKQKAEEERKKREEEERLKKEEEERIRQEELERQAEEKKRLKKEREKEKLLKKKQEGKLLTGKQKEEARRREAMRNQFLARAGGVSLTTANTVVAPKRPKYRTKKSKPHSQVNGETLSNANELTEAEKKMEVMHCSASPESEKVEKMNSMDVEEKPDVVEQDGMEEEDDEEEWDAKSWDDDDLKLLGRSAFADEEAD